MRHTLSHIPDGYTSLGLDCVSEICCQAYRRRKRGGCTVCFVSFECAGIVSGWMRWCFVGRGLRVAVHVEFIGNAGYWKDTFLCQARVEGSSGGLVQLPIYERGV